MSPETTPAPDSAAPLGTGGPAPQLLSPERLAEIEDNFEDCRGATTPDIRAAYQHIGALLAHAAALSTQLAAAKEVIREGVKAEEMFKVMLDEQDKRGAELLARAEKAEAQLATAKKDLGTLYATIFGDGGHKQAELEGKQVEAIDWLTGEPDGTLVPALPGAAIEVIMAKNTRAEDLAARLVAEQEAATADKLDLLAEFYAGTEPVQYDVKDSRRRTSEKNGENRERGRLRSWAIIRAHHMGIDPALLWERPAKGFDAPADVPAPALPLQGAPAAADFFPCVACLAKNPSECLGDSCHHSITQWPQNTPSAAPAVAGERRSGDV